MRKENADKTYHYLYQQGVANLKLEGMSLSVSEHKIVREYQTGKLSHADFIRKAIARAKAA